MNKGTLNETLLIKNINKIDFYANEEYKCLLKFYQELSSIRQVYNSNNINELQINLNNSKNNILKIRNNRKKYTEIMLKAIGKYQTLSENTKTFFEKR